MPMLLPPRGSMGPSAQDLLRSIYDYAMTPLPRLPEVSAAEWSAMGERVREMHRRFLNSLPGMTVGELPTVPAWIEDYAQKRGLVPSGAFAPQQPSYP